MTFQPQPFSEGWALAGVSRKAHYYRLADPRTVRSICGITQLARTILEGVNFEQCKNCRRMLP